MKTNDPVFAAASRIKLHLSRKQYIIYSDVAKVVNQYFEDNAEDKCKPVSAKWLGETCDEYDGQFIIGILRFVRDGRRWAAFLAGGIFLRYVPNRGVARALIKALTT